MIGQTVDPSQVDALRPPTPLREVPGGPAFIGGRRRTRRTAWQRRTGMKGIGALKKGALMGYSAESKMRTRHATLRKVVHKVGPLSTFRKLNAVATYSKKRAPKASKTFRRDRNWVRKTFLSHKSK